MMLYLVEVFNKKTGEFVPCGVFDDMKKVKRIFDGYKYSVVDYQLNKVDYDAINQIEN